MWQLGGGGDTVSGLNGKDRGIGWGGSSGAYLIDIDPNVH